MDREDWAIKIIIYKGAILILQKHKMNHLQVYRDYARNLNNNKSLFTDESNLDTNDNGKIDLPVEVQGRISSKILDYYRVFIANKRIWSFAKNEEIRGFINIIPLTDPGKKKKLPDLCGLTIIDSFLSEACVGFYFAKKGAKPIDELYYLYFEDEPKGLNVDMEGYVQLLYMARGFAYWQEAVLSLQGNPSGSHSSLKEFKKMMPKVFPDFKWEEFVALYEKVKLK